MKATKKTTISVNQDIDLEFYDEKIVHVNNILTSRALVDEIFINNVSCYVRAFAAANRQTLPLSNLYQCGLQSEGLFIQSYFNDLPLREAMRNKGLDNPDEIPENLLALLLEDIYSPILDLLLSKNSIVNISSCRKLQGSLPSKTVRIDLISHKDDHVTASLWLPLNSINQFILTRSSALPYLRSHDYRHLYTHICLSIGDISIDNDTFMKLIVGDVLVTNIHHQLEQGRLHIEDSFYCHVKFSDNENCTISTAWRNTMDTENSTNNSDEDLLDYVPVRLSFDIAEKHVSLKQLEAYRPDYTFIWQGLTTSDIKIRANGKLIGRGKLVQVGDNLGVKLLESNHATT